MFHSEQPAYRFAVEDSIYVDPQFTLHIEGMEPAESRAILDAIFEQDPQSRVACETMCTTGMVVVAGEISTQANVDYPRIVRDTVREALGLQPLASLECIGAVLGA